MCLGTGDSQRSLWKRPRRGGSPQLPADLSECRDQMATRTGNHLVSMVRHGFLIVPSRC